MLATPTDTSPKELLALYRLARAAPQQANALEIGSYLGGSARVLAAALRSRGGTLVCVDTWQNQTMPEGERDTFPEFERNTRRYHRVIRTIRKDSRLLSRGDLPSEVHLCLIDGDHGYDAVKSDFVVVEPVIAREGVIAFHDAVWFQGVSRVVGEALASGQWQVGGLVQNLMWIRKTSFPPRRTVFEVLSI